MSELSRAEVRRILAERVEELVALWPDIPGTPLDEIIPLHLEREGLRFVAEEDDDGPPGRHRLRLPRRARAVVARPRRRER